MLKNLKSKFSYITYPFFGTYSVPDIDIQFEGISAMLYKSYMPLKVDNSSNYLQELLSLEIDEKGKRFKFHITAKNTQQLIMLPERCLWGIDITGRIHNLKRYEEFERLCLKPSKITKGNLIWFKEISKPTRTPLSITNIEEDLLYYWFSFLYIDHVWELYKISPDYTGEKTIWI